MSWAVRSIASVMLAVMPVAASALTDGYAQYDECVLLSLRDSWNPAAARLIRQSCDALYLNNAMLLPRERRYHECILQSLPGVRDNVAIREILTICSRRGDM
ncbi:VF_A0006 family four-cysteine protein [Burkholderia sp. F1]|uniref:VF_A0006 family four-cysteine protein n=1 Tax=Burkholderia sp. F1 TaxID=3366817 RepID=UPI003D713EE0